MMFIDQEYWERIFNIHLNLIFDFRPSIFGYFVAFLEIQPFATEESEHFFSSDSIVHKTILNRKAF